MEQPSLTPRPTFRVIKGSKQPAVPEHKRPLNIIAAIRHSLNLSHTEWAKRIGISKHALIRLEQGTYSEILPVVMEWLLNNTTYTELLLTDSYADFQTKTRALHRLYFGADLKVDSTDEHPLRQLRGSRNLAELAKDLCLPYSTLAYFERNYKQQKSVPKNLVNVLREIGYSHQQIVEFRLAYDEFRVNHGCESILNSAPVGNDLASSKQVEW